jgi:hypothetical protein
MNHALAGGNVMLKRIVAAAVLALIVSPALAEPVDTANAGMAQPVAGPTKPGARLSYQMPKSEGVVSEQRVQQEKQVAEKMACTCHHE